MIDLEKFNLRDGRVFAGEIQLRPLIPEAGATASCNVRNLRSFRYWVIEEPERPIYLETGAGRFELIKQFSEGYREFKFQQPYTGPLSITIWVGPKIFGGTVVLRDFDGVLA